MREALARAPPWRAERRRGGPRVDGDVRRGVAGAAATARCARGPRAPRGGERAPQPPMWRMGSLGRGWCRPCGRRWCQGPDARTAPGRRAQSRGQAGRRRPLVPDLARCRARGGAVGRGGGRGRLGGGASGRSRPRPGPGGPSAPARPWRRGGRRGRRSSRGPVADCPDAADRPAVADCPAVADRPAVADCPAAAAVAPVTDCPAVADRLDVPDGASERMVGPGGTCVTRPSTSRSFSLARMLQSGFLVGMLPPPVRLADVVWHCLFTHDLPLRQSGCLIRRRQKVTKR